MTILRLPEEKPTLLQPGWTGNALLENTLLQNIWFSYTKLRANQITINQKQYLV